MKVNFGEADNSVCVKDIRFPSSEIPVLKKQEKIITHRVSSDADKFEKGDYVYCEEIDDNYCFEVTDKKVISKIEDSPYFKDLTKSQINILERFNKISVLTLRKTKYERPYKLSTIKEKYPEKIYLKLKSDKVHSWRARTGIELVHLEPDEAEQTRTWKNWGLMSTKMKSVSDEKCREWFGVDNKAHYDIVKDEKNISDDKSFQDIIKRYKHLFGFDLSKFRLVSTKTPRYRNGKPADIPLNEFGGCYTELGVVYINSDLKPVMKFYGVKTTEEDLKKVLIAHELGHAVYREFSDSAFRKKILDAAKSDNFTTEYLEHVKQEKLTEETFCEYIAAIITGKVEWSKS